MKFTRVKWALVLAVGVGSLVTIFSNCGQPGSISKVVAEKVEEGIQQTLQNCNEAQANGRLISHNQVVTFADSRVESGRNQICEFGANGNLSMMNEFMRARYEQNQSLNIPPQAVVCDIRMSTSVQSFRYDDVFFLTFNRHLLASNNKSAVRERLTPLSLNLNNQNVGFFDYDWMALRGARFQNVADDFCAGQDEGLSSCTWPISEQPGNIVFNFDRQILIGMGLLKNSSESHSFGFAITGDDDPNLDCYHEQLSFSMQVQYYLPQ